MPYVGVKRHTTTLNDILSTETTSKTVYAYSGAMEQSFFSTL